MDKQPIKSLKWSINSNLLEKKNVCGSSMGVIHAWCNWEVSSALSSVSSVVFVFKYTRLYINDKNYWLVVGSIWHIVHIQKHTAVAKPKRLVVPINEWKFHHDSENHNDNHHGKSIDFRPWYKLHVVLLCIFSSNFQFLSCLFHFCHSNMTFVSRLFLASLSHPHFFFFMSFFHFLRLLVNFFSNFQFVYFLLTFHLLDFVTFCGFGF